jgi:AraC family transcriptional regulator
MLNCAATQILNVGSDFAKNFRLREAPSLLLTSRSRPQMAITRITVPAGLSEPAGPVRVERGFTIPVYLRKPSCQGWGTWVDGKFLPVAHWAEGGIAIYDLESNPWAWRTSAYDCVHFNLPRATLEAFTSDSGVRRIDTLSCPQGKRDDVMFGLAKFIIPWLGDDVRMCDLTFDYFVLMFCSHVSARYGNVHLSARRVGGLVLWQQRRVKDLIDAGLHQALRLSTLAEACGLSLSHFCRSFKQSFGVPAHRYVIQRRVELAKSLLQNSSMPLAEIALRSGFYDQAAFSRAFSALVGTSPKRWRNEYKSSRSSRPFNLL